MWKIVEGDCRERLAGLETASVDAVITDPPYPGALRSYGVMAEGEWLDMMDGVVDECKRVVKPGGSAMFVVQPNGEHVGQMRLWLYEFVLRAGRRWNLVQDVLWFNTTPPPNKWCNSDIGLLRPAVKYCVWLGPPDCHRDQEAVRWLPGDFDVLERIEKRTAHTVQRTSGYTMNEKRLSQTSVDRETVTPFNVVFCSAAAKKLTGEKRSPVPEGRAYNHPARTPEALAHWWLKYICPAGGTVLDPFAGVATIGVAAVRQGKGYVGIEQKPEYCEMARERLARFSAYYEGRNDK